MPQTSDSRDFSKLVEGAGDDRKLVLAEGDSWFAYPRKFFLFGADANVIDHLADYQELIIYNSSSNGDEALSMLSGEQKFSLIKRLMHNEFDYLLFSGGGNDIVGKFDFDFFIQPMKPGKNWESCVRKDRVKIRISQIEGSYRTLCELVKDHSANKQIKVFTHTYDKLVPKKEGFKLFDLIPLGKSWLYPYLYNKGIKKKADQVAIVDYILKQFSAALTRVEKKYSFFHVVDTYGTVGQKQWRNEIHPNSKGFGKIAKKIYAALNSN